MSKNFQFKGLKSQTFAFQLRLLGVTSYKKLRLWGNYRLDFPRFPHIFVDSLCIFTLIYENSLYFFIEKALMGI